MNSRSNRSFERLVIRFKTGWFGGLNNGEIIPSAMNSTNRRGWSGVLSHEWYLLTIGLFALLVRLGPPVLSGGIRGIYGYDDGLYFSAAQHLIAGVLPYRDFVFAHPTN
jgi:hypothetical protein